MSVSYKLTTGSNIIVMFDNPNFSDLVLSARSCSYSKESATVRDYKTSTSCTLTQTWAKFSGNPIRVRSALFTLLQLILKEFELYEINSDLRMKASDTKPAGTVSGFSLTRALEIMLW